MGVLIDARYADTHVSVAGSRSIAKRVKALGGDAVIILASSSNTEGFVSGAGGLGVLGLSTERVLTQLQIIKYL